MKSVTTNRFRKSFAKLPKDVQRRAREAYQLWKVNPRHAGLHFKKIEEQPAVYSVRVGLSYRALGVKEEDTIIWFWIGSHEEYNKLISQI